MKTLFAAFLIVFGVSCGLREGGSELPLQQPEADGLWPTGTSQLTAEKYVRTTMALTDAKLVSLERELQTGVTVRPAVRDDFLSIKHELFSDHSTNEDAWKLWPRLYDHGEQVKAYYQANPELKGRLDRQKQKINQLTRQLAKEMSQRVAPRLQGGAK